MLQQGRRERPSRKPIPQPYVGAHARKNQSSSPSMTAELIPAAPQAERATANVLRRTAIRVLNLEPDQATPAMPARKDRNRERHQTTTATLQMCEGLQCPDRRGPSRLA